MTTLLPSSSSGCGRTPELVVAICGSAGEGVIGNTCAMLRESGEVSALGEAKMGRIAGKRGVFERIVFREQVFCLLCLRSSIESSNSWAQRSH